MNANRQTAVIQANKEERNMKISSAKLIRWAGLSAMAAGIIFAGIQPIHPPDVLASVNTSAFIIITSFKTVMCLFGLFGIAGLYARQVEQAGWLGLVGFLLLSLFYALSMAFQFIEAFLSPLLAISAPTFVEGFLGIASGHAGDANLGALPAVYALTGIGGYMLGGLLFGIATFRAGILPRWPSGLLAVAAALTPLAALLPHAIQRLAGIPVGLALAWLGYALWSERRERAAEAAPGRASPQLGQSSAE